jgi:L-threonylcarbamoyladenylate synthase
MNDVTARFETADEQRREDGLAAAVLAVRRGELVIFATDTVYGIACDAFDPAAVARLLDAKGRGRDMPPPVLVSAATTLDALATEVPDWARSLTDAFWPGPLTIVCKQQSSLQWDLGDTRGTVAVRMPQHDVALDLIQRTGPLAVSSANLSGMAAATDADQAISMLADEVALVLDSGATPGEQASTIVDCTGHTPRILRDGALPMDRLRQVLSDAGHPLDEDEDQDPPEDLPEDRQEDADTGA